MKDRETVQVYDTQAQDYARMTDRDNATDPRLVAFIAKLPAGGRVLDLGCGPGASAAVMAQAGLQVDATDASAEMVAMAARHAGVTAWQATFHDLDAQDAYDGLWANFSLLHAPRADMPVHLAQIATSLVSGGQFHLGLKLGTGSARDSLGRLYTYYTQDDLNALLHTAGFAITEVTLGRGKGLDGSISDWISLSAHA